MSSDKNRCYLCSSCALTAIEILTVRPEKETDFGIPENEYRREIELCRTCGVYNNFHRYDFEKLYSKKYNADTYKEGIFEKYREIMTLAEGRSDNKDRVKRIAAFFSSRGKKLCGADALDIGSGLCVFLGELVKLGVRGYCVDPDVVSTEHAIHNAGIINAYTGSFADYQSDMKFNLISFNKILEHVKDPIMLLKKAKHFLKKGGFIYMELPDGEEALKADRLQRREEFYIEHYTIFTPRSLLFLSEAAGLIIAEMESIAEPSGKYTLYAFLTDK